MDSAGTEGVTFCREEKDAVRALERFLGAKNVFGIKNDNMLVQEYLQGTE